MGIEITPVHVVYLFFYSIAIRVCLLLFIYLIFFLLNVPLVICVCVYIFECMLIVISYLVNVAL